MREDLIPVLKTVERGGTHYRQTYWVKHSEVKEAYKSGGLSKAAELLGGSAKEIHNVVYDWKGSCLEDRSIRLRGAAASVVFKGDQASLEEELGDMKDAAKVAFGEGDLPEMVEGFNRDFKVGMTDDKVSKDFAAMAGVSQAQYDEETVTVYRGVFGEQARQIREAAAKGENVEIDVSVLSSFTEDEKIARKFGRADLEDVSKRGLVFKLEIPRQSIIMSHRVAEFPLIKEEQEVVVLTQGRLVMRKGDIIGL